MYTVGIKQIIMGTGGAQTLAQKGEEAKMYIITGSPNLTADVEFTFSGDVPEGTVIDIWYQATPVGGQNIEFFGINMPQEYNSIKTQIKAFYTNSTWYCNFIPDAAQITVIRSMIMADAVDSNILEDDSVTTSKILAKNVTVSKLEDATAGQILVANASSRPSFMTMSGDSRISSTGVLTHVDKQIIMLSVSFETDEQTIYPLEDIPYNYTFVKAKAIVTKEIATGGSNATITITKNTVPTSNLITFSPAAALGTKANSATAFEGVATDQIEFVTAKSTNPGGKALISITLQKRLV